MGLGRIGKHSIDGDPELGLDRRGRVCREDPRVSLDDLGQRPEGDAVAVREGAALAPEDQLRPAIDVLEEFPGEA